MNYSLQGNRKTEEGNDHPDRDAQFPYINEQVRRVLAAKRPVISVETKKKELLGNDQNDGRQVSVGKLAELKAARDEVSSELQALDVVLTSDLSTPADSVGGSAYRRLLAFPTLLRSPTVSTLLTSLSTLENQRSTLLTRRTMRDPEVVTLTGQIGGVEAQIRGERCGTDVERVRFHVAEGRAVLGVPDGPGGGEEGEAGDQDVAAGLGAQRLEGKQEGVGARGAANGVLDAQVGRQLQLQGFHLRAEDKALAG